MILFACGCVVVAVLLLFTPAASKSPAKNLKTARNKVSEVHNHPSELILDVSASLLDSGMPIKEILDTLGRSVPHSEQLCTVARCLEMNMEWDRAWHSVPPWLHPLEKALRFAHVTGAPAASLLRNAASLKRRERSQRVARLGAQFGTRLVLPLGACALPAFIALGVVPLIIALLPGL
ncbi:type II secretion system F family protein [Glutamicibacter sp.]|jgi:Type II secretory pathway, component PulF|uniref:type II secretion system F family protein n=1 Tax=Glutamicibacter sp. TaxID=1931995 RepID=UPI002B49EEBB|nr:type II secretion system F family protein [Glutamicibacter sp.]HJX79071.1 type II secretion system F family protein [Glutamicibacter sp.]